MIAICLTVLLLALIVAATTLILTRESVEAARVARAEAARADVLASHAVAVATVRVGRPTTIHTVDGKVLTGVLLEELPDRTRLVDAKYVEGSQVTPVPGGVATVLRSNESWRQDHEQ